MSKWMQALAVALAAVVGVVPAFAQFSYAQAVPIPAGEELDDAELATVEGEAVVEILVAGYYIVKGAIKAAKLVGTLVTVTAPAVIQQGCQKAVQVAGQAATKIGELTMRVTLLGAQATQHPAVRDTVLGMTFGVTGEAVRATVENRPLTLADVGFGLAWGGLTGAGGHWIGRGRR